MMGLRIVTVLSAFVLTSVAALAATPRVIRQPYLQLPTTNSMVLRWRTDRACKGIVQYGLTPDSVTNRIQHPGTLREHVAQLTGLKPNTRYWYSLWAETNRCLLPVTNSSSFVTPPLPGTLQPVRVWVIGDAGTGTKVQAAARDAIYQHHRDSPIHAWLLLGDNAYSSGTDEEYQQKHWNVYSWIARQVPIFPALGNHDAHSADSPTDSGPYYDMFTLPTRGQCGGVASGTEAYYSYDWANVHFVCLDSEDSDRSHDGAMAEWLRADLSATRQDWIVAYFHHPPYTKGSHDSDAQDDSGGRMKDMREVFLPILEDGGVDLVMAGHSHGYERSRLLDGHYGESKTLQPEIHFKGTVTGRPDLDGVYHKEAGLVPHQGAVYVVNGSSGHATGGRLNHPAMWVSLNKVGSLLLDFHGQEMKSQFITDKGQVQDYFTLRKTP